MRKILLAGVAMVVATGTAWASDPVPPELAPVTITTSLAPSCSATSSTTTITLTGTTPNTTGAFSTTCNFSVADLHVNFFSENGGVYNSVEDVKVAYTLKYRDVNHTSASLNTVGGVTVDHTSGGDSINPVSRSYSIALDSALAVGGTYSDKLFITVSP